VPDELPLLSFEHAEAWSAWLAEHHAGAPGAWLRIAKAGSGATSVSYSEALDVALCYGWIDGQKGALDSTHWRQRFTPRGPRSRWSQVNRQRAEALIADGRMRPAGLAQVQAAQADGRWEAAYPGSRTATVPDDLRAALDAQPAAAAFFATLNSQNRFAVLYRVHDAKRPATRAARIEKFVAMLARGETIY
jgi:uncharacterized protein YdeI (YjbR/CyaY-like superfamily)